ncbi:hypothetical protein R1sor_006804 [Riccia sorocarpa]|uniref:Uncharacterized protein n=1 Tax=Riccia sorocarpa TaxID=122646 RepID=A0ABD3HNG5_9MARC
MAKIEEWMDLPSFSTKLTTTTSSAALVDEKHVEKEEVAEVPIPWRTSRRLQEATLKSLQERNGSGGVRASSTPVIKKEKGTFLLSSSDSIRSAKRQHSPPAEAVTEIDESDREIFYNTTNSERPLPESCINSGRKRRKVHFADPLSINIDDQKRISSAIQDSSIMITAPSTTEVKLDSVKKSAPRFNSRNIVGMQLQPQACPHKLPLSCLDLLCNHVGPKGWRCYRFRLIGESFCSQHKKQPTSEQISLCIKPLLNLNKAWSSS